MPDLDVKRVGGTAVNNGSREGDGVAAVEPNGGVCRGRRAPLEPRQRGREHEVRAGRRSDEPGAEPDGSGRVQDDAVLDGGPGFGTLQALWQEDADSVVVSGLHGATLLSEESRSGLNALVAAQILETPGAPYGLIEVNNVCDSGPALLAALRSLS